MPKGSIALPLLPHSRGFAPSYPQHSLPPDTIVDGLNVVYSSIAGGRLTRRPGYTALGTSAFSTNKVTGIYSCAGSNGATHLVAADTLTWWSFSLTYGATDITGGVTNTGGETDYWRFAFFPQGGNDYIIGTNSIDPVRRWQIGAASYTSPAAFPVCTDVMVLANRVVALNVIDSGTRYNYGVKWSASNDATTWPATAIALLADSDDPIIAGRALNRESGLIYRSNSIWKMTAQAGGDATAFRFDLVERTSGPINGATIVTLDGIDYYHCFDLHVRSCDGIRTTIISEPIDSTYQDRVHGMRHGYYSNDTRSIWWQYSTDAAFTPDDAIAYAYGSQRWEPPQQFALPFYSSHYGQGAALSSVGLPMTYLGGVGRLYQLSLTADSDNGTAISYQWTTPKFSPDSRATYLPDEIENYFVQTATAGEEVTVQVFGFEQPEQLDSTKTTLIEGIHDLAAGPRFRLAPKKDISATQTARYLQVVYSGASSLATNPMWSGGFLYVYPELS